MTFEGCEDHFAVSKKKKKTISDRIKKFISQRNKEKL